MASAISMASSVARADEQVLNGARRSRFSLHFKTPRVRRWLLVQIVSVPVGEEKEEVSRSLTKQAEAAQPTVSHLLDEYVLSSQARRFV